MNRMGFGGILAATAFVMLFAVGCADQNKEQLAALQSKLDQATADKGGLENQLRDARDQLTAAENEKTRLMDELAAAKAAKTTELPEHPATGGEGWEKGLVGDKVTLGTDILFATGKADLTAAGRSRLDAIARDLKSQYSGLPVRVYGYTDNDPIRKTRKLWKDNLDLSANRSMEVTRYLISRGISKNEIETVAMGDTHFLASNTSAGGKAKNRRVEIVVIKVKS